jgi:DNA topoisomerase III
LSALQATANKRYKFSPKKTLDIMQQLYQKGFVSYPRSDSSFVTEGEADTFPVILEKLSKLEQFRDLFPLPIPSIKGNKRYVNEKKVTDHYAIIPTEQVPNLTKLSTDEQKMYDLIVRQLIAAHYEKAIFDYTTIQTLVDGRAEFVSKGKMQIQEGWRKVIFQDDQEKDTILPIVKKEEQGLVKSVKVKEGKTQPPKRYTEGQLITLMKTAGKHLEDNELEKILMKAEGLGTEATRAGIITMLKDRNYIDVKKNQVFATDKGKVLIQAIGDKILASPEMTAKWEQRLAEIGQGKASPSIFMEQTKKLCDKIIQDALEGAKVWSFEGLKIETIQKVSSKASLGKTVGTCKLCSGSVIDKGKFYGCTNYNKTKCTFTISKLILGKKLSQANVQKLLSSGKTELIKGFKKGDKTFDSYLVLSGNEFKMTFLPYENNQPS